MLDTTLYRSFVRLIYVLTVRVMPMNRLRIHACRMHGLVALAVQCARVVPSVLRTQCGVRPLAR